MNLRLLLISLSLAFAFAASIAAPTEAVDTDSIVTDSARIAQLTHDLQELRLSEAQLRLENEHLSVGNAADSVRHQRMRHRIDSLKAITTPEPIIVDDDTLFVIYAKQGGLAPKARAELVAQKIERVGKMLNLEPDSVRIEEGEFEIDVKYGSEILISLTELDALWAGSTQAELAADTRTIIIDKLKQMKEEYGLWQLIKRIGSVIVIILVFSVLVKLVNRLHHKLLKFIDSIKDTKLKPFHIQHLELLDVHKQYVLLVFLAKTLRVIVVLLLLMVTVPLIFSIFPQTKDLAHSIVMAIWRPVSSILIGIISYIPNLLTIIVIFVVIRYIVRILHYIAKEVADERLKIGGFFPEWGLPTFYIVRFLLYAFMVAMIYPYLPGSDSGVFQGVSVFVGLIVSLGSSSMIGNLIAGIVITYMRPFKIGDRVEVKGVTGDVIEKNPFVTRIRTPKNEIVTMPNSFIMSSETINYSQSARDYGLIIHTDVNIGYETPSKKVYDLLIEAALRTHGVVADPKPFVLVVTLGDYYPVYQINAYIRDSQLLPDVYSWLHTSIMSVFAREGIEVLSPHYVSTRDGNASTVPLNFADPTDVNK